MEELEAIRDACQGPWAICGDFNLILSEEDKNNQRFNRTNLSRFRRTVASLEMQDLHLHGRCFTWSNERENPTLVRLDRVLVSIDWDEMFPSSHLRTLESMHPITARFSYIPTWGACPRRDSILKFSAPDWRTTGRLSWRLGAGQSARLGRWHASMKC